MKKYYLIALIINTCFLKSIADPCSSIITINCGSSITFSAGGSGNSSYPNGMGLSCNASSGQGGTEQLYKFIAPITGTYQFKTTSATFGGNMEYFYKNAANGCSNSGWTCLGYTSGITPLDAINLSAGDSIYVLVNAESTSSYNQTFQINCGSPFPCETIQTINCGIGITFQSVAGYGNPNYPNGMGLSCNASSGQGGSEHTYKFIAPVTGTYQFKTTSATFGGNMEYFYKNAANGCSNSSWTCLGYTSGIASLDAINLSAGDSIYVLANAESTSSYNQTFQINCGIPFPCETIQTINCGIGITFQSVAGYGNPNYPNGMGLSCNASSGQGGSEHIYKFIAPVTGTYQFKTTSATFGGNMEYFYKNAANGCSNSGWTCLGYTSGIASLDAINLSAGDSIYVLANAESTSSYNQTFQINCGIPFPCETIQTINCGIGITFQSVAGYGNPNYPNGMGLSCNASSGQGGSEQIYKFIAPITGTYQFKTISATFGGIMEYFYKNAANGCSNTGWTCLGYTSGITPLDAINLSAGDSIYVLANAESTSSYNQTFQINCGIPFPCETIQTINCGIGITFQSVAGYGNPNYPKGMGLSCNASSGQGGTEHIYKFIASTTGAYLFKTTAVSTSGYVEYLYKNAVNGCSNNGWMCLNYTNNIGNLATLNLNAGDSILILANAETTTIYSQSFKIDCAIPTVRPVANFTVSDAGVCVGQTVVFTDASYNTPTSWYWSFPGGTPASSTIASPSVTYNVQGTYDVTLIVNNFIGADTLIKTVFISVVPLPPTPAITSSGSTTFCQGGNVMLTSSAPNGNTWSNGDLTQTTTVSSSGLYTVTVDNSGCTATSPPVQIAVNSGVPIISSTISGSASVCSGSTYTYSIAAVSGAADYTWSLPSNWAGSSTATSIAATANTTSGTIIVTANNACGQSIPQTLNVNSGTIPGVVGAISGSNTVCSGSSNMYNIAVVTGAIGYTWVLPNDWIGISTTNSISTIAGIASGSISVTANNNCGSSSAQVINVSVPIVNSSVTQSGATLTADASGATYQWMNCNGNTSISAQNNQSFTPMGNGDYSVIITQNGCTDTSACYTIFATKLINNEDLSSVIKIYPNPSSGIFIVKKFDSRFLNYDFGVYNVLGEKVYSAKFDSQTDNEVDLSWIKKGFYLVNIVNESISYSHTLIIQ